MKELLKNLSQFTDLWNTYILVESSYTIQKVYAEKSNVGTGFTTSMYLIGDIKPAELELIRRSVYSEGTPQMYGIRAMSSDTWVRDNGSFDITDKVHEINGYDIARCMLHQELHKLAEDYGTMQMNFETVDRIVQMLWLARMLELYVLLRKERHGIRFTGNLMDGTMAVCDKCIYDYFTVDESTTIAAILLFKEAISKGDIDYNMKYERARDLMEFTNLKEKLLSFDPFERVG